MFNDFDLPLVRAFLDREARDFWKPDRQDRIEAFVSTRMAKLKEASTEVEPAAYIMLTSLSNMGFVTRQLTLTPKKWNPEGTIEITLCTCGSINCWGTIIFPSGKVFGSKGVVRLDGEP